jgi:hypothetical protein
MRSAAATLRIGDLLDRQFALLRGEMETSKLRTVTALARVFQDEHVPYAVIGGVAVQLWSKEPRTTLDLDVAVASYDDIPRDALQAAGFVRGRRFAHSENWKGPDGAPVQFTDDAAFAAAVRRAEKRPLGDVVLRVAPVVELIRAKLRAADDPARRRSKRLIDLADAVALAEQHPSALRKLRPDERERLAGA